MLTFEFSLSEGGKIALCCIIRQKILGNWYSIHVISSGKILPVWVWKKDVDDQDVMQMNPLKVKKIRFD